jgi:hypothetical protein
MKHLLLILCLLLPSVVCAEDIYITQTASGSDTGASCANAHSTSWLNTAGNWASGADKISAGDTVHLCGTITSPITIQGSGSSGSPITILFETGAKLSKTTWLGANNDSALYGTGVAYITIDGGSNGLIEATDNGTNLTHHDAINGVYFYSSDHIIVKNLIVNPMYLRVYSLTDNYNSCNDIFFGGQSTNIEIKDCHVEYASDGIFIQYTAGAANILIHDNYCNNCGHGCNSIASSSGTATISNVQIYNNSYNRTTNAWAGNSDIHCNLIHAYAVQSGSQLNSMKIYNNYFSGICYQTSFVFLEGYVYSPQLYNNVFYHLYDAATANYCGNGGMYLKGGSNAIIANNTFVAEAGAYALGLMTGGWGGGMDVGHIIKNNIFIGCVATIYAPYDTTAIAECDYNIFYGADEVFAFGSYSQWDFAGWKTQAAGAGLTFDAHSKNLNPSLDANHAPTSGDTVAKDSGVSMATYFTTDKLGNTRTGTWDIGAYEYGAGGASSYNSGKRSGGVASGVMFR